MVLNLKRFPGAGAGAGAVGLGSRAVFGRLRALLMTGGGHEEEEAGGLGDGSEGRFWVVFASCGWVSGEGSVAEIGGGSPSKRLSAIFPGPADLSKIGRAHV